MTFVLIGECKKKKEGMNGVSLEVLLRQPAVTSGEQYQRYTHRVNHKDAASN